MSTTTSATNTRRRGSPTLLQEAGYQPVTSTPVQSNKSSPRMSPATGRRIFSPALEHGPMPADLPGGLRSDRSGPAPVRANPGVAQASVEGWTILDTYGPSSFDWSVPSGPLSSWESRLRARLAWHGSTEFTLTWREAATPAGLLISQLARSMRPTDGTRLYWAGIAWRGRPRSPAMGSAPRARCRHRRSASVARFVGTLADMMLAIARSLPGASMILASGLMPSGAIVVTDGRGSTQSGLSLLVDGVAGLVSTLCAGLPAAGGRGTSCSLV